MSKRTKFTRSLLLTSAAIVGAHLSIQKRNGFCKRWARLIHEHYPHVQSIPDIRWRHVALVIANPDGLEPRSLANKLSYVRALLEAGSGNHELRKRLDAPNRTLGIPSGSRKGTGRAPDAAEYAAILARATCPYLNALLRLERTIGLRAAEAVRSGRSLTNWLERLRAGKESIEIIYGAKGGRRRMTHIPNIAAAIAAIENAIDVRGKRVNIVPKSNLEQAMTWYRNATYRLGIKGHGLRYAFAHDALDRYLADGKSMRDALSCVAMDLGHGDLRGRWVKLVYCRQKLSSSR